MIRYYCLTALKTNTYFINLVPAVSVGMPTGTLCVPYRHPEAAQSAEVDTPTGTVGAREKTEKPVNTELPNWHKSYYLSLDKCIQLNLELTLSQVKNLFQFKFSAKPVFKPKLLGRFSCIRIEASDGVQEVSEEAETALGE